VVKNDQKDGLVAALLDTDENFLQPDIRQRLPGEHGRTRAFIKVQDGCDNACTFCITHVARGRSHSRTVKEVLADINVALAGGVQEIVLTGVHLGSWGQDFDSPALLHQLIEAILVQTKAPRLRLSSLEPWDLDKNFFSLWKEKRLCPHLHLPLQSGSSAILKRMARKTTPESFTTLLEYAREIVPDIAITTDFMVGFPGEGEAEFAESLAFVKQMNFADGHVFQFSPRPGTPAARFTNQVDPAIKKQRSVLTRSLFTQMKENYQKSFLGGEVEALWEKGMLQDDGSWIMEGLTGNYLRVKAVARKNIWNQISRVKLENCSEDEIVGSVI
jgi:threonylcarbamoyladenosine tRNA methylthiotransferase MtaB